MNCDGFIRPALAEEASVKSFTAIGIRYSG
jgi:hypothetical protein